VIAAPSRSFADTASIDLGSKTILLSYHGLGHTDSDIAISVEGEDVVFLGDLVEESGPPHFDDGYPIHWPGTLRTALHPGMAVIVPGHGDTMSRAEADRQLEELESVALLARECVESGAPVSQAARQGPYPVEVMISALTRAVELGL
jgi:glyoxylase-like metal-dependent hydrolase (beta-lactamase superfamily II)